MINAFIKNQDLTISQPLVAADTIDYLEMNFIFQTSDWENAVKWCHFRLGDIVYDIKLNNNKITKNQHLNLTNGIWDVYLHGNIGNERITTDIAKLDVTMTGELDGVEPPVIPPTVAEQLQGQIGNLENLDTNCKDDLVCAVNEINAKSGGTLDKSVRIYSGTLLKWDDTKSFGEPCAVSFSPLPQEIKDIKIGDLYLYTGEEKAMPFQLLRITLVLEIEQETTVFFRQEIVEKAVIDYVAQEIAKIPKADVDKAYVDDIKNNLDDEINLLTGEVSDVKIDVGKPIHTTLNVEIEDDGFGGYRADYNDNDINNHRNAGGIVQAKYYNQAENQTYTYYYSTMESDRKPTFIRTFINADGKAEQVLVSIGNDKKVTVERRISSGGGVSQEYVEQNFASIIKDSQSGEYLFINDFSKYQNEITINANVNKIRLFNKNILSYPFEDTTKTVNGITYTDNGDGTITVNGTATGDSTFSCRPKNGARYFINRAPVRMSGCPQNGSRSTYCFVDDFYGHADIGNGYIRTHTDETSYSICVKKGAVCENLIFKPMISYDLFDSDYVKGLDWIEKDVTSGKVKIENLNDFKVLTISTGLLVNDKSAKLSAEWSADTKQWLLNELNKRTASTQALALGG